MTPIYIDPEIAIYAATAGAAFAIAAALTFFCIAFVATIICWCIDELPYLCYRVRKWAERKWRA